jgi:HTH-type transcriptional regulator/antitoxin MqsA
MKCAFCCGETKHIIVTFSYEEENRCFLVEHVPAEVCERCGEKTYSPDVTDQLLKFSKDNRKPIKKLEVPVFDYAAV